MPHLFEPLTIRGLTLKNRIMMSPMCQYRSDREGLLKDWHYIHYGSRAVGGVGLIMVEATAVESRSRLTEADLGIWDDRHVAPLARLVALCHELGARVGLQICHAGRRAWLDARGFGPEQSVAPSPVPFDRDWSVPEALAVRQIDGIVASFQKGARRALEAGFDVLELHGAHGFLVNQFLSPLANYREDEYGGSVQGRMRFLHRVIEAVREVWPERLPLFVRVSASDWTVGGMDIHQMLEVARTLPERGVDLVDCSSGSVVPTTIPTGPGYQVPFAERIRQEARIPTAAVGLISSPELAEEIVRNQRADLIAIGRALLRDPYWPLHAAQALDVDVEWPREYRKAKPRPRDGSTSAYVSNAKANSEADRASGT